MSENEYTPGPWEYVASNEHHGAYVAGPYGDICDCYVMSNPSAASVRNGGDSYPIPFQGGSMDANARLIAAAPEMLEALKGAVSAYKGYDRFKIDVDAMRAIESAIAKAEGKL